MLILTQVLLVMILSLLIPACRASPELKYNRMFCQYDRSSKHHKAHERFTVQDIPAHLCTDILVGFFEFDIQMRSIILKNGDIEEMETELFALKRGQPHLKLHLTVGVPNASPPNKAWIPIMSGSMMWFADLTAKYLNETDYDGINIYYHGGDMDQDMKLLRLLHLLHDVMKEPGSNGFKRKWMVTVTLTMFPLNTTAHPDFFRSLYRVIDYLILKVFDSKVDSRPIETYTRPLHLDSQNSSYRQYYYFEQSKSFKWLETQGIPPEKIVMGFAAYARALIVPRLGTPTHLFYPGTLYNATIIISRTEVCRIWRQKMIQWTIEWSVPWQSPYMSRHKGHVTEWIFYENRHSIVQRVTWLLRQGYAGMMFWTLDNDDFTGDCERVKYPILSDGTRRMIKFGEYFRKYGRDKVFNQEIKSTSGRGTKFYILVGFLWLCTLLLFLLHWYLNPDNWRSCDDEC